MQNHIRNKIKKMRRSDYICFSCYSALSLNVSKESLPNDTSILHTKNRHVHNEAILSDKGTDPAEQDDFSDIVDYIMLDINEREKYKLDLDRQHPVIDKIGDTVNSKNPTLGQLKNIKLE